MKIKILLFILITLFVLLLVLRRKENFSVGICLDKKTNTWGNLLPEYPNRCLTDAEIKEVKTCDDVCQQQQQQNKKLSIQYLTPNHTECMPKNTKKQYFQELCQQLGEKKHDNLGLKQIVECENNMIRGICEAGYRGGMEIPKKATPCMLKGTDFNSVCADLYGQVSGYKEINTNGCNAEQGYVSATCSDRYISGKIKKAFITDCVVKGPEQENTMTQQCSDYYNYNFDGSKIQMDCPAGFERGMCSFKPVINPYDL